MRNSFVTGTPRGVGQIICELIPVSTVSSSSVKKTGSPKLPLSDVRLIDTSEVSRPPADAIHTTAITTDIRPTNISLPRPFTAVPQNTTSCLPTPEMEVDNLGHPIVHSSFPSPTPSPSLASASIAPKSPFSTIPDSSSKPCELAVPSDLHDVVNLDTPLSASGQFDDPPVDSSAIHHSIEVTLPPSHPLPSPQSSSAIVTVQSSPMDALIVSRAANQTLVEPPRLVVVNPTPNPTPHPTPPTTPHISGGRQQWLSPPIRGSSRVAAKSMSAKKSPAPPVNPILDSPVHEPPSRGAEALIAQTNSKGDTITPPGFTFFAGQPFPQQTLRSAIQYNSESAQDNVDRNSVSSITSSDYSHASTATSDLSSTATASTTSASSNGGIDDEEKVNEFDVRTGYLHMVGNMLHPTITRLGSPSTIKSIPTDHVWTETTLASDSELRHDSERAVAGGDKQFIEELVNAREQLALSSKPQSPNGTKHLKRMSAPVPLTSSTNLFPSHAGVVYGSPETSVHFDSANNTGESTYPTTAADRSTSQSRSGGSTKGSQAPSRDHSVAADLSGLGTLGGYTIAAAYPPPSMIVRKQVAVGGKGRVKVAIRGLGKARPVRRHSAGPGLDVGGKGKEREGNALQSERQELPHIDQQLGCQPPMPHGLTLITEEKPTQSATAAQTEIPTAKVLHANESISDVRRPPKFNIGSGSDEGSAVGSKSAGSGSSVSGGHSQHIKKLIGDKGVPHGRTGIGAFVGLDALLIKQQERQQIPEVVKEMQHRQAVHSDGTSHTSSPTRKSKKQDNRNRKKYSHQSPSRQNPVSRTNMDDAHSPGWMSEKAKGKLKVSDHEVSPAPPASKQTSKSKSKSTPNLGLDPVLAAKVRDSLADPLLPKGRPVVVDTESEDETDTEDGWSSEEMTEQAQVILNLVL